MADTLSIKERSIRMSRIHSNNTTLEYLVRKFLYHKGIRYRINVKGLPGKPDVAIKKYQLVIFINGCYWHGHENCKIAHIPKTRSEWWREKIERNKNRDMAITKQYQEMGWTVLVVWECELAPKNLESTLSRIYLSVIKSIGHF